MLETLGPACMNREPNVLSSFAVFHGSSYSLSHCIADYDCNKIIAYYARMHAHVAKKSNGSVDADPEYLENINKIVLLIEMKQREEAQGAQGRERVSFVASDPRYH